MQQAQQPSVYFREMPRARSRRTIPPSHLSHHTSLVFPSEGPPPPRVRSTKTYASHIFDTTPDPITSGVRTDVPKPSDGWKTAGCMKDPRLRVKSVHANKITKTRVPIEEQPARQEPPQLAAKRERRNLPHRSVGYDPSKHPEPRQPKVKPDNIPNRTFISKNFTKRVVPPTPVPRPHENDVKYKTRVALALKTEPDNTNKPIHRIGRPGVFSEKLDKSHVFKKGMPAYRPKRHAHEGIHGRQVCQPARVFDEVVPAPRNKRVSGKNPTTKSRIAQFIDHKSAKPLAATKDPEYIGGHFAAHAAARDTYDKDYAKAHPQQFHALKTIASPKAERTRRSVPPRRGEDSNTFLTQMETAGRRGLR